MVGREGRSGGEKHEWEIVPLLFDFLFQKYTRTGKVTDP